MRPREIYKALNAAARRGKGVYAFGLQRADGRAVPAWLRVVHAEGDADGVVLIAVSELPGQKLRIGPFTQFGER